MDKTVIISLIVYIAISFISILLHDLKYLFFLNGNNKAKAVTVCVVYTVLNTWVTKNIASQPLEISIPVITITNGLSMWIAMWYSEKSLKEFIYKFEISIKSDEICEDLKRKFKEHNIPWKQYFYYYENDKEDEVGDTKYCELQVYCFTKDHSRRLTNILKQYDYKDVKYVKINTSNYKG